VPSLSFRPLTKHLPWEKARAAGREAESLRNEAAALYRALGVPDTASFEEINAATKQLQAEYARDVKKKMQLGVVKDKIMEVRLRQRVTGNLGIDADARASDLASERAEELRRSRRKWEAPGWTRGVVKLPDGKHLKQTSTFLGGATLGCLLVPSMASSFTMIGAVLGIGLLYNRGQPPVVRDDMGNPGEVRPVKPSVIALTVGLNLLIAFSFVFLGVGLMKLFPAVEAVLGSSLVTTLMLNAGFFVACTFFQTYKDGGGGKKKRKVRPGGGASGAAYQERFDDDI
jgi:hypothetical protein